MIGSQISPTHAVAEQLPMSQSVLWTRQISYGLFHPSVRIAETRGIGMID